MPDELDRLAMGILRDAATMIDKMRGLAIADKWTADEALSRAVKILREVADRHEEKTAKPVDVH